MKWSVVALMWVRQKSERKNSTKNTVELWETTTMKKAEDVSFTCPWWIAQAHTHVYAHTQSKNAHTHFVVVCVWVCLVQRVRGKERKWERAPRIDISTEKWEASLRIERRSYNTFKHKVLCSVPGNFGNTGSTKQKHFIYYIMMAKAFFKMLSSVNFSVLGSLSCTKCVCVCTNLSPLLPATTSLLIILTLLFILSNARFHFICCSASFSCRAIFSWLAGCCWCYLSHTLGTLLK